MASNLRVDTILPSSGLALGIGTASGTTTFTGNASITGNLGIGGTLTYEDVTNIDSVGLITARTGIKIGPSAGVAGTFYSDGSYRTSGIVTASSFSGTVASSNLSGALPAIDGSALTGINTAFGSGTSVNTTGIITATAFIPSAGQLSNRNLIINGAMNVSQRATTSTSGSGYKTLDRWGWTAGGSGVDYITQAQVALTSADAGPWALGFRNSLKITNGNQSSSSGTANYAFVKYKVEAQDVAQSGWEYTSASSKITLTFWVKSSVAQNYHCNLKSDDGTAQNYPFDTGTLTAGQWTKITKTIPGHANIQINNDNGEGLALSIRAFTGADWTDAGVSLNAWAAWASGTRVPVSATTWWDTDNATFAITGVQLEVGDTATNFEHRSYGDELVRCLRYCWVQGKDQTYTNFAEGVITGSANWEGAVHMPVPMRSKPSTTFSGTSRVWDASSATNTSATGTDSGSGGKDIVRMTATCSGASFNTGRSALFGASNDANASVTHSAEL